MFQYILQNFYELRIFFGFSKVSVTVTVKNLLEWSDKIRSRQLHIAAHTSVFLLPGNVVRHAGDMLTNMFKNMFQTLVGHLNFVGTNLIVLLGHITFQQRILHNKQSIHSSDESFLEGTPLALFDCGNYEQKFSSAVQQMLGFHPVNSECKHVVGDQILQHSRRHCNKQKPIRSKHEQHIC